MDSQETLDESSISEVKVPQSLRVSKTKIKTETRNQLAGNQVAGSFDSAIAHRRRKLSSLSEQNNQINGHDQTELLPVDLRPNADTLQAEILRGLQKPVKTLPTKLLYDQRGSQLFDQITELDEYYPTRTETDIMRRNIDEIVEQIGQRAMLIEYGSGSSLKTRILLDALQNLAAYVPIDISAEHLAEAAKTLHNRYPELEVLPVTADYMRAIQLPASHKVAERRVVFFPGSTIGNFQPDEALAFLQRVAAICGQDGGLLIGVDLKKDPVVLHRAYNDVEGVTADFNLNILAHINREFDTGFHVDQFRHYAYYNAQQGRIEMHLVNLEDQNVQLQEESISLRQGETIWTESSYKYTIDEFYALTSKAGFSPVKTWTDAEQLFSVHFLESK